MIARLATTLVAFTIALPLLSFAQSDLQSTIRAAITSDPRSAAMTQAQIDAMVSALSQGAQQQGVTPAAIVWRPEGYSQATGNEFCAPYPQYLCIMSATWGFFGPDYLMPMWLAVLSLLFILVNAVHQHHLLALRLAPASSVGNTV